MLYSANHVASRCYCARSCPLTWRTKNSMMAGTQLPRDVCANDMPRKFSSPRRGALGTGGSSNFGATSVSCSSAARVGEDAEWEGVYLRDREGVGSPRWWLGAAEMPVD